MANPVTIVPAIGYGLLMSQTGPSAGYSAIDDRRTATALKSEGVLSAGGFKVSQRAAGANMTVDVAASTGNGAYVQGDSITAQGLYLVPPHTAVVNVDVPTADATNPRLDLVVLEVKDNEHDVGGLNVSRVRVIAGTPTAGATLDNRSGAPALPASSLHLADVLVAASDTSIIDAEIRDYRAYAAAGDLVGEMKAYGGATAPAGWKLCDGAALKRGAFAALFTVLSTTYGAGDASTTFNLPDLRGRVPVGVDGAAARLTANDALGNGSGAEKNTLAVGEMPAHDHGGVTGGMNGGSHPEPQAITNWKYSLYGAAGFQAADNNQNVDHTHPITAQGGGGAHNNMQPFQIVNWIIFTGSAA